MGKPVKIHNSFYNLWTQGKKNELNPKKLGHTISYDNLYMKKEDTSFTELVIRYQNIVLSKYWKYYGLWIMRELRKSKDEKLAYNQLFFKIK